MMNAICVGGVLLLGYSFFKFSYILLTSIRDDLKMKA